MVKTTLKNILAHKLRLAMTALAIIVGVGFVAGTFIFTDTIDKTFNTLFEDSFAGIDVLVQSETEFAPGFAAPPPFDEELLSTVQGVPGVAVAEGSVFGYAQLIDKNGEAITPTGPPTLGGSWNVDERLWGNIELRAGRGPEVAGEVTVDARTAKDNDLNVGDVIDVLVPIGRETVEVVGIVGFGETDNLAGATFTGFELREAQRVLDRVGMFDSISVKAADGLSARDLSDRIAGVLPDGFESVVAADEAAEQAETLSDSLGFLQTVLLAFALVAVLVASFIIFNTFRIIVGQRVREFGLLRAVGASTAQVVRMVVLESFIVGVIASLLGLGFGWVVSQGLTAMMSAVGFDLPSTATSMASRTIIVGMAVGVIVTMASALYPAIKASRIPPIAAIQEIEFEDAGSLRRLAITGGITTAVGVALILNGLFGDVIDLGPINELTAVLAGGLVVFVGVAILSVLFIKPLARVLAQPVVLLGKITGRLARDNSVRRPRRTAATASALMIGLALVGFFFVLGDSIKASASAAIEESLRADFVITTDGFTGGIPTNLAEDIAAADEVEVATPLRLGFWDRDGSDDFLLGVDPLTIERTVEIDVQQGSLQALAGGGVFVYEDTAKDKDWMLGDRIPMGFAATGLQQVEIVGIYAERDVLPNSAAYLVGLEFYEENFTEVLDFAIGVKLAGGVSIEAGRAAVDAVAVDYPNVNVEDQAEFRKSQEEQVDVLLNVFTMLLVLAVIIALMGITNTLVLSVYERTREIGLLRAVGLSRWQTRRMVLWESIIVAIIGGVLGIIVGVFFGIVVVTALGSLGITEMSIPTGQLLTLLIAANVVGVIAAIFPARRAARLNVLEAIGYE